MTVVDTAGRRGETVTCGTMLVTEQCPTCGVLHAHPKQLQEQVRRSGGRLYCPNGHYYVYGDGETERLKRELEWARNRAGRLAHERDQAQAHARAEKAAKTRIRNDRDRIKQRVENGICPCCNRHFANLERHMQAKHPGWKGHE